MAENPNDILPLRMEDVIDLQHLCIPLSHCVGVSPGAVDEAVLKRLKLNGFDQAPVFIPESEAFHGLVDSSHLRHLFESGQPLRPDDPAICRGDCEFRVGSFVTVFGLLHKMSQHRAVIVICESDATEFGHLESVWGLFTISDLNRHTVRSAIYRLLAAVESGFANWLEGFFPEPWEWLQHLEEEQQVRVLGFWELSRRQNVDVGPIAALTLTQLLHILGRCGGAAEQFGYPSRTKFTAATSRLPVLRNRVMHPVRPLVLRHEDVDRVHQSVLVLGQLREKLELLVGKNGRE